MNGTAFLAAGSSGMRAQQGIKVDSADGGSLSSSSAAAAASAPTPTSLAGKTESARPVAEPESRREARRLGGKMHVYEARTLDNGWEASCTHNTPTEILFEKPNSHDIPFRIQLSSEPYVRNLRRSRTG